MKDKVSSMKAQMTEMMKLLQAMSGNSGANASNALPHPTNVGNAPAVPTANANNLGINARSPSTSGVAEAGQATTMPIRPQNPTVAGGESHGYHEWNQAAAYTYEIPGADPTAVFTGPALIPNQTLLKTTENSGKNELKEEISEMKDRLRALQGPVTWKSLGLDDLCLDPEVPVPKKFKVPEFMKYNGSGDPHYHLKSYCTKMSVWSRDEKFLINFFHESLTGSALNWFMKLDHSRLKRWEDLTDIFMRQYKFNLNTAPTREQLKGMKKKVNETFKEYAQRWRSTAAEVQPPLMESEFCSYFIRTLSDPYYKIMLGTHVNDFADLIVVGERIDSDIRDGRLEVSSAEGRRVVGNKKKEGEVNYIQNSYQHPQNQSVPQQRRDQPRPNFLAYQSAPQQQPFVQQNPGGQSRGSRFPPQPRDDRPLPNFNVSRTELYNDLVSKNLMGPKPLKPLQPPFPAWYDPNVTCAYHMGAAGHTIDKCDAFRRHVLMLIDNNHIGIKAGTDPNIVTNPLPNHDKGKQVAMISGQEDFSKSVMGISYTMEELYEYLASAGYISIDDKSKSEGLVISSNFCSFHGGNVGHDINGCTQFREFAQKMMTLGVVRVEMRKRQNNEEICTSHGEGSKSASSAGSLLIVNKPVYEVYTPVASGSSLLVVNKPALVPRKEPMAYVHVPTPFPYHDNHAVPWNYGLKIECATNQQMLEKGESSGKDQLEVVGGITRSGRVYSEGKEKEVRANIGEGDLHLLRSGREKDVEGEEFLKIMKQSEYDVVEQLGKTPA